MFKYNGRLLSFCSVANTLAYFSILYITNDNVLCQYPRGQCYKTSHLRNLQMFEIS
jgi:hypothetical protein